MRQDLLLYRGKPEIAEQAVINTLREAIWVVAELLRVGDTLLR